jgi:DNA-binding PadR family transcriptional regulator
MLSTPGATPRKLLTILKERGNPITDGALRRLLNRYEKWGYVKSSPIIERDPTSGKPRKGPRTHLYSLMEKGQKWLVEAKALQDHGYPPRPGRYKVGA